MILAHAIGGRSDLPIPLSLLITGATVVLVITFLGLALMWTRPRLQDGPQVGPSLGRPPTSLLLRGLGLVGLILVIGQAIVPLLGAERASARPTIAPVSVWVLFWLVIPFAGAVLGDWYSEINPWRSLARLGRVGRFERIGALDRAGVWPAAAVLVGFAWLELIGPFAGDPVALGLTALCYTIFLLVAMSLVGRETGLAVFDAFTPYNRLFSAISPLGRNREGSVVWRGWLRSLPVVPEWPGLWVLVVAMIATVSYDGVSGTSWFESVTGGLGGSIAGDTFLLLATINLIALGYYLTCLAAARFAGDDWTAARVAQRFAHTLVPIALAYALAHYFTLVLFEGQQILAAASDPFGLGWDLLGTAERRVDYFIRTSRPIWFLQVAFIVGGHLVGVVLAHDRSLRDFGRDALRSQYAMLVLMIALTSLGLVILSG